MRFKEFMEAEGLFGSVATAGGELRAILNQIKLAKPVKGRGNSIRRMFSAGNFIGPAGPVGLVGIKKPKTIPSLMK